MKNLEEKIAETLFDRSGARGTWEEADDSKRAPFISDAKALVVVLTYSPA